MRPTALACLALLGCSNELDALDRDADGAAPLFDLAPPSCEHPRVFPNGLVVRSTDDLDMLRRFCSEFNVLDGDLIASDVPHLDPLSCLCSIGGDLELTRTGLTDLDGFTHLRRIGGGVMLRDNPDLQRIGLDDLDAGVSHLIVQDHPSLLRLDGPQLRTAMPGDVVVTHAPQLTAAPALRSMTAVKGDVRLEGLGLEDLRDVNILERAGSLTVSDLPLPARMDLPTLRSTGRLHLDVDGVVIWSLPDLEDGDLVLTGARHRGLEVPGWRGGALTVHGAPTTRVGTAPGAIVRLTLRGVPDGDDAPDRLALARRLPQLERLEVDDLGARSLDGLYGLTALEGDLVLRRSAHLADVEALRSLDEILGDVIVSEVPGLSPEALRDALSGAWIGGNLVWE